jgi:hypothetical protein
MTPVYGWLPLWSADRKLLVQVFTSADGLIERVTVNHRLSTTAPWGPSIEVTEDCSNDSCA